MNLKKLQEIAKNFTVLYAEDHTQLRENMEEYLNNFFAKVTLAEDGQKALDLYHKNHYDIVITDIQMPNMNGIQLSENIIKQNPLQEIIIVSAHTDSEFLLDCIALGISGYIVKPVEYDQISLTLYKVVDKLKKYQDNERFTNELETMVEEEIEKRSSLEADKLKNYEETIKSFVSMLEERDSYTAGHSQRVAHYSKLIAQEMSYSKEECADVYEAGILHDIGKVATPDSVLLKPGKLNDLEYSLIKDHVVASARILSTIPMYAHLVDIVASHHEYYNGSGYPKGLTNNQIHPLAHIMILADAFDAMTTNRIYKGRKNLPTALEEIKKLSGTQFHPDVVSAALKILPTIELPENATQFPTTAKEQERFSYFFKDQVTGLYNKNYLYLIWNHPESFQQYKFIMIFTIDDFHSYNMQHGWDAGDTLLRMIASTLQSEFTGEFFHIFGDNFLLLNNNEAEKENIPKVEALLNESIKMDSQYYDIQEKKLGDIDNLMNILKGHQKAR